MFASTGYLRYFKEPLLKVILEIDQEISDYYRSFVPKYIKLQRQMYPAHVSVVRKEMPKNMENWCKYDGKLFNFEYEGFIFNDEKYYWLNVFSTELENVREELGLEKVSDITRSPDGKHRFHTTIGNVKNGS
jgi:hypothetical protein